MEEKLITFPTAQLAREKGFSEMTGSFYEILKGEPVLTNRMWDKWNEYDGTFSASTQHLLARWLRETHKILVYLIWYDDELTEPRWSIYVHVKEPLKLGKIRWNHQRYCGGNKNYEDGLELGLLEGLKLIK